MDLIPGERETFSVPYEDSELWPINAWRDAGVTLEVIDPKRKRVVFSNGVALPILEMRDAEGFVVEEWEDCVRYDFGHPRFGYGSANAAHDTDYQH